jgi:hypothetical protein
MQTSLSFCKARDNRVRLSETLAITFTENLLLFISASACFVQSFFKPRNHIAPVCFAITANKLQGMLITLIAQSVKTLLDV